MKRVSIVLLPLLIVGVVAGLWMRENYQRHAPLSVSAISTAPDKYLYYMLKDSKGFMLARALKGASNQPLSAPQPITLLGNSFGVSETDNVLSTQLSPDRHYLAIDGTSDHGEQVWIYDTQSEKLDLIPAHVMGNFLHWLPHDNGHSFLYRPMLPLGPEAPLNGNAWNPGLWVVDAATGAHNNIDIGVSSADLVDAVPAPDGARIIYSTTSGLGMGSDTFMMNSDGSGRVHLFNIADGAQTIAGFFTWSPDSTNIAYERLSDSVTPFLPASLWIMNSQGGQQRWLAAVDGGHGFMPAWSPDGSKIAVVVRTNVDDHSADIQEQALRCAIGVVDVLNGRHWLVANAEQTGVQMNINPVWMADSESITFAALNPVNRILGGMPRYWSAHVAAPGVLAHVIPLTPVFMHIITLG